MTDNLASRVLAAIEEAERIAQEEGDGSQVDRLSTPGHDRDVARAIANQARLRHSPITDVQVQHLLLIGYQRGQSRSEGVLRRCAADRKIVELHTPRPVEFYVPWLRDEEQPDFGCSACHYDFQEIMRTSLCSTLKALAEGYGIEVGQ